MISYYKLYIFISLSLLVGCTDNSNLIKEQVKEVSKYKIQPFDKQLLLFTDKGTYLSSRTKFEFLDISDEKHKLKLELKGEVAYTSGKGEICRVIINDKKAVKKYGKDNISLLVAHEIGHCYGSLLNDACNSPKCLHPTKQYKKYVEESFSDFIGIYKLAKKSKDFSLFSKKRKINSSRSYEGFDYQNSNMTLDYAESLFTRGKYYSDLKLAEMFIEKMCTRKQLLHNKCVTNESSRTD